MAGDFFYSVSIYGIDRATFLHETQCDKFSRFITSFEKLFRRNHKVVASLRIDQESHTRVPQYLSWLASYPIRKVTLLNTRMRGRLGPDVAPLDARKLEELRRQVIELALPFPTVFPAENSGSNSHGGLIVLERPPSSLGSLVVNGHLCSSLSDAGALIRDSIGGNGALFSSENYVWGTR